MRVYVVCVCVYMVCMRAYMFVYRQIVSLVETEIFSLTGSSSRDLNPSALKRVRSCFRMSEIGM